MASSERPLPYARLAVPLLALLVAAACAPMHAHGDGQASLAQAGRSTGDDAGLVPVMGRHGEAVSAPTRPLADECRDRRDALAERLGDGFVWLTAAEENELGRFFQSNDFYYLTGVESPEVAMAMHVRGGRILDEVLFLQPRDLDWEVWNGARLYPGEAAEEATGFRRTLPLDDQQSVLDGWGAGTLYTDGTSLAVDVPDIVALDTQALTGDYYRPGHLAMLRLVKSDYEIRCLENAIDITGNALHDALHQVRPGAWEYQVQAAIEAGFMHRGAERPGFASICGAGQNSVTLHYNANRAQLRDGDLIVCDVGAKYRYYCADVTRTLPVNGRFTPRQREVYELVLAAQTAAAEAARPGITMAELDAIARKVIDEGGFGPGRKYFKHGLGHWIGLDVHDVGGRSPIEVGTLFTIEPGIYIADEGLGVRIEDDYIMTPDGAERLSTGFPSDPDEIEALMARLR